MLFDRMTFHLCGALAWLLCELAFKTDCRGPFAWAYRAGCWLYGKADDAGIRSGELVPNERCRPGGDEPLYVRRN
jgi:hypothetical protein